MNAMYLTSFLIAFVVCVVAIKKFGISDEDILDIFYYDKSVIDENREHIRFPFSRLEINLLILEELKKGVSNPIKISESTKIPLDYLMEFFVSLVYRGLIEHENENVFLREPIEINAGLKITEKGKSVLKYLKDFETEFVEPTPPEVNNEIIV